MKLVHAMGRVEADGQVTLLCFRIVGRPGGNIFFVFKHIRPNDRFVRQLYLRMQIVILLVRLSG